ncbi:MAG: RNA polymerase sigma factor [Bryobacteraceae bacterium]
MAARLPDNTASLGILPQSRGMTLHERVERLFVERREEIYAYLVSLGVRPEVAQEIAQESFLKYYTALREGQSIENPRAWVYAVAHNLAVNARLRPEVLEVPALVGETPESLALARERMAHLRRAIENLSPQQRSCLHLRAEGFRYREIAGILGINPSTVGEFLQRAVKRLLKAIYE